MPETPDWAAAPQSAVVSRTSGILAIPGGNLDPLGIAQAGRRIIIVGLDVYASLSGGSAYELRSWVMVRLINIDTAAVLVGAAVSPGSPFATNRPPFGSVRGTVGSDIEWSFGDQVRTGSQYVEATVYYYYE